MVTGKATSGATTAKAKSPKAKGSNSKSRVSTATKRSAKQPASPRQCRGGFITTIAKKLNYAVESLDKVEGSSRIGLHTCQARNMIATEGDIHYLVLKEENVRIPLPDVNRTTVQIKKNWKMPFDPTVGIPLPATLQFDDPTTLSGSRSSRQQRVIDDNTEQAMGNQTDFRYENTSECGS